jgi:hypothetical protein
MGPIGIGFDSSAMYENVPDVALVGCFDPALAGSPHRRRKAQNSKGIATHRPIMSHKLLFGGGIRLYPNGGARLAFKPILIGSHRSQGSLFFQQVDLIVSVPSS